MLHWLKHYRRALLPGDISAGLVVAMMTVSYTHLTLPTKRIV